MPPYDISEPVKVFLLAVIQGITEFLPISSSGHLVAANALFDQVQQGAVAELNIVLHFGTLLAILVFYRKRIIALLSRDKRVIPLLIVGTLPAVVAGLYVKKVHEKLTGHSLEWLIESPLLAGFMLPLTGFILLVLPSLKDDDKVEYQKITIWTALLIGLAQAFAILPGISRSGSTIVAGALLGLRRQSAATFSFLLAIPVIAGGALLEFKDIYDAGFQTQTPILLLVMGVIVSFLVGLLALQWLVKWIEGGKLHLFAYWVIPLGFLLVVWQLYQQYGVIE